MPCSPSWRCAGAWRATRNMRWTGPNGRSACRGRDGAGSAASSAGGGGLFGFHTACLCFDDWDEWRDILGGVWVWGRSRHPPLGPAAVSKTAEDHPLTSRPRRVRDRRRGLQWPQPRARRPPVARSKVWNDRSGPSPSCGPGAAARAGSSSTRSAITARRSNSRRMRKSSGAPPVGRKRRERYSGRTGLTDRRGPEAADRRLVRCAPSSAKPAEAPELQASSNASSRQGASRRSTAGFAV